MKKLDAVSLALMILSVPSIARAEEPAKPRLEEAKVLSASIAAGTTVLAISANAVAKAEQRAVEPVLTKPRRVDVTITSNLPDAQAREIYIHELNGDFRQRMDDVVAARQRLDAYDFRQGGTEGWQRLRNNLNARVGAAGEIIMWQVDVRTGHPIRPIPATMTMLDVAPERAAEAVAELEKAGHTWVAQYPRPSAVQTRGEALLTNKVDKLGKAANRVGFLAVVSSLTAAGITAYEWLADGLGLETSIASASDRQEKPAERETASVPAGVQTPSSFVAGAGR